MHLGPHLAYSPKFSYFDNDSDNALEAAAVLPEQFYSLPSNAYTGRPEVSLMQAVLEDAVNCFQYRFQETGRRNQRLAQEAEVWFFSNDTQGPFFLSEYLHGIRSQPLSVWVCGAGAVISPENSSEKNGASSAHADH